jgi:predicted acetyltransferase
MNKHPGTAIFITDDDQGVALGFIQLRSRKDYYYHEDHGHIADFIVAPEGEGRGILECFLQKMISSPSPGLSRVFIEQHLQALLRLART